MIDSLVIIPTYNEALNVEEIIHAIKSLDKDYDILVVDDSSPDGTADKVRTLQEQYEGGLFLLLRPKKNGLGKAYIDGLKWAMERAYDFIFEMDADFSHNPKDLDRLYYNCKKPGVDMVIGSRYISGVNVVNWPLGRIILSYGASFYVRFITGMPIKDPTAGFICYRKRVLDALDLDQINFIGYAFQIEIKYKAYIKKFKILEIPIIFRNRKKGSSKMTKGIIGEAVLGTLSMRIKSLRGKLFTK